MALRQPRSLDDASAADIVHEKAHLPVRPCGSFTYLRNLAEELVGTPPDPRFPTRWADVGPPPGLER